MAREITYNNFKISFVVFMPNITTNHAITYTNCILDKAMQADTSELVIIISSNWQAYAFCTFTIPIYM